MDKQEEWMSELFAAIDQKNAQRFSDFFTNNGEFQFGRFPVVEGNKSISEFTASFFESIESISHQVEDYYHKDGKLICHGLVTYTRLNGTVLTVPFCNWLYLKDNLVHRYLVFADISQL